MVDKADKKDTDRLIPLAKAFEMYGFNQAYLATLTRKGRLKAINQGASG